MNLHFQYHFHPAMQGLFASGCLHDEHSQTPKYLWVYDCGSVSKEVDFKSEVATLKSHVHAKKEIDLLTISHFDKDHISGLTELLGQFQVQILLLPYVPLFERLLLALHDGVKPNDPRFQFYQNPVEYLRAIEGAVIERIIIVGQGGEPQEPDFNPEENPNPNDGSWITNVKTEKITGHDSNADPLTSTGGTEWLPGGSPLTIQGIWEFVPYNSPRTGVSTKTIKKASQLADAFLQANTPDDRTSALNDLKDHYDKQFGSNSKKRNVISLFLYSGPLHRTATDDNLHSTDMWYRDDFFAVYSPYRSFVYHSDQGKFRRCSILYSGDGYLSTAKEFKNLVQTLTPSRLARLGVFQVNHHGAKGNWHKGLADKLKPCFSVFCSDPNRGNTYHPNAEVLRDFWPYTPIQVNQAGFMFGGQLY